MDKVYHFSGTFGGYGGAPGPLGGLSGGPMRSISPGGRIPAPETADFGSLENNKDSPQTRVGSYESGVKDSPQINPDSISVSTFETGVRVDDMSAPLIGCPGKFQEAKPQIGSISGSAPGGMCLELLCGTPCANGYKVDQSTGCKTCQCLQISDSLLQACPSTSIKAMWTSPTPSQVVIMSGKQLYMMKGDRLVEPSDQSIDDLTNSGTLCDGIDSAFTSTLDFGAGKSKYTVYFSGNVYSIYSNMFGFISGPHSIHSDYENGKPNPLRIQLPMWVKKVDSAMARGHKVYLFFKWDESIGYFAVYDTKKNEMRKDYPKRTAAWWDGLPLEGPDAAVYWDRKIYFTVKDSLYVSEGEDVSSKKIS